MGVSNNILLDRRDMFYIDLIEEYEGNEQFKEKFNEVDKVIMYKSIPRYYLIFKLYKDNLLSSEEVIQLIKTFNFFDSGLDVEKLIVSNFLYKDIVLNIKEFFELILSGFTLEEYEYKSISFNLTKLYFEPYIILNSLFIHLYKKQERNKNYTIERQFLQIGFYAIGYYLNKLEYNEISYFSLCAAQRGESNKSFPNVLEELFLDKSYSIIKKFIDSFDKESLDLLNEYFNENRKKLQ